MKLTLGFSPCPNDTFIFDALVNKKIDTEGIELVPVLEDIETLNKWAVDGKLDVTKLSFPAFFKNLDEYISLSSGGALGNSVGPLLVAKNEVSLDKIESARVAIPGVNTTANFLFSFAFPKATNRFPVLFSTIEDTVLNGAADLGLLIHENRFTYHQRGLVKIMDMGEYWQQQTGLPIPLACIAVKRTVDKENQKKIGKLIKQSVAYAFANYPHISPYVKEHSQAMEEEVMRKHIDLYVNDFSIDLGEKGKAAIERLYEVFSRGMSKSIPLFLQ
jgi:1,4-dihydroxy-6-naphthoate synthase